MYTSVRICHRGFDYLGIFLTAIRADDVFAFPTRSNLSTILLSMT